MDYNKNFEEFRDLCQEVTEYYFEERYPFLMASELTKGEVKLKIEKTGEFILKLKEGIVPGDKVSFENCQDNKSGGDK